jgi:hypothetical protein
MSVKYFDSIEEELVAFNKVREFFGHEPPKTCGAKITVALYVRDESGGKYKNAEGRETSIHIPEMAISQDTYSNCVGMVIGIGPLAYNGERFKESGPWCKFGDWVVIARNSGIQFFLKGKPVHNLYDDLIEMVIEKPSDVTRYK